MNEYTVKVIKQNDDLTFDFKVLEIESVGHLKQAIYQLSQKPELMDWIFLTEDLEPVLFRPTKYYPTKDNSGKTFASDAEFVTGRALRQYLDNNDGQIRHDIRVTILAAYAGKADEYLLEYDYIKTADDFVMQRAFKGL
jgi:hypothetical protein